MTAPLSFSNQMCLKLTHPKRVLRRARAGMSQLAAACGRSIPVLQTSTAARSNDPGCAPEIAVPKCWTGNNDEFNGSGFKIFEISE